MVTLLAVLELARLKVVRVLQSPDGETLFVSQVSGSRLAEARRVEVTSALGEETTTQEESASAEVNPADGGEIRAVAETHVVAAEAGAGADADGITGIADAAPDGAAAPAAPDESQGDHEQT